MKVWGVDSLEFANEREERERERELLDLMLLALYIGNDNL
jgi:hypothetical protein